MSRIGKLPVQIPEGVEITISDNTFSAKGSKGELSYKYSELMEVKKLDDQILVSIKTETKESVKLYGLTRTLVANIVKGVSEGFEKRLSIHGVGFKAQVNGRKLILNVGFSHPVEMDIPENIEVKVEKNNIIVSGADKEKVGQLAADIRSVKKPEPYKGKGIKYENERIIRKAGKAAKA
jgi:large subunit ribosomal protein L6